MLKRRLSADDGATLVEFAIASTVFFLLILLIVQGALTFHGWLAITHAARDAARAGAPCYGRSVDGCTLADVESVARNAAIGVVPGTLEQVQAREVVDASNRKWLEVSLRYRPAAIAPMMDPFVSAGLTLSASSEMRLENQ